MSVCVCVDYDCVFVDVLVVVVVVMMVMVAAIATWWRSLRSPTGERITCQACIANPRRAVVVAPRRLPMGLSSYGRFGRCLAKVGRGTLQEEFASKCFTTRHWTNDPTNKLIDANSSLITCS